MGQAIKDKALFCKSVFHLAPCLASTSHCLQQFPASPHVLSATRIRTVATVSSHGHPKWLLLNSHNDLPPQTLFVCRHSSNYGNKMARARWRLERVSQKRHLLVDVATADRNGAQLTLMCWHLLGALSCSPGSCGLSSCFYLYTSSTPSK